MALSRQFVHITIVIGRLLTIDIYLIIIVNSKEINLFFAKKELLLSRLTMVVTAFFIKLSC